MKAIGNLFVLVLLALPIGAGADLPADAMKIIAKAFPHCEVKATSVGTLYGKDTKDVAASLDCPADASQDSAGVSGPFAVVILAEDRKRQYRISYEARGLLPYFGAEIKKGALFLHSGFPGTGGGQTATSYDYQFRYDGRNLVLIGMRIEVDYIGNDKPTRDQNYYVSANYLTGVVIDSRIGPKGRKVLQRRRITLEEFVFEPVRF